MLDEYVIVPDVFDPAAYSNAAFVEMCLPHLKEPLLSEALVRDLCDGGWVRFCQQNSESLHRLCKEMIRKLAQNNRLRRYPSQGVDPPTSPSDWCREGLAAHGVTPVTGIIAGHRTKQAFAQQPVVASIEKLTGALWWQQRSSSVTLARKTADYSRVLQPVMAQARSLMFIDPYLNPKHHNYREFAKLFGASLQRDPAPRIEFHRTFFLNENGSKTYPLRQAWEANFLPLGEALRALGLTAEVFCWDDFHDRFMISDVVGLSAAAGFDVKNEPNYLTVWTRLGRDDKDRWQLQFDPGPMASKLKWRFTIG